MRELNASTGFLAHGPDRVAHFGFGDSVRVDEVRAEWVSGDATVLRSVPVNQAIAVSSPAATIAKRDYELGEPVLASGADVEPLGTPREWLIEGVILSDPLVTAFSSIGRKDLELRVYANDGVTLVRAEVLRVNVVPFTVTPVFTWETGVLELVWDAVPGWSYRVESCTNLFSAVWEDVTGPVAGDGSRTARVTVDSSGRATFYRVKVE